jgi:hypothetical protein
MFQQEIWMDPDKKTVSAKAVGNQMDADVKIALETLLRLCNKAGISFGGMMMRLHDRPFVSTVGNVVARGSEMAELFRQYAQIVDDAVDADRIETCPVSKPN